MAGTVASRMSAAKRREQLLDATKEIVSEEGFHAVSIEAVARRAGVSRPIVYGHFQDLGGLLEALVQRESERALGQLESVLDYELGAGDPTETLITSLRGYLEAVRSDPVTWRLVLMPSEGAPRIVHEQIRTGRQAVIAQLTKAVEPGTGTGDAPPDPELTAWMLSAFSDEAARLILTDPERYSVERVVRHARWALGRFGP